MDPYFISQERLSREIEKQGKALGKGVINWFYTFEFDELVYNIYYDVFGVTYLCRVLKNEIIENLKQYVGVDSQIIGFYEEPEPIEDFVIPDFEVVE